MTIQSKYGLAAAVTQTGFSHVRRGIPCEDASLAAGLKNGFFIAVSDGHGGADYPRSREGANLACEIACSYALEYQEGGISDVAAAKAYARKVLDAWLSGVRRLAKATPVTEEELAGVSPHAKEQYQNGERLEKLYGCTLLCALCFPDKSVFVQIGDGDCFALLRSKKFLIPVAADEDCQFNVTSSLCGVDAEGKIRTAVLDEPVWGVFLCSDGVSNSFESREYLLRFFSRTAVSFQEADAQVRAADFPTACAAGFPKDNVVQKENTGSRRKDSAVGEENGGSWRKDSTIGEENGAFPTGFAKVSPVGSAAAKLQNFLERLSREGSGDDVSVALCLLNEKADEPDRADASQANAGGTDASPANQEGSYALPQKPDESSVSQQKPDWTDQSPQKSWPNRCRNGWKRARKGCRSGWRRKNEEEITWRNRLKHSWRDFIQRFRR